MVLRACLEGEIPTAKELLWKEDEEGKQNKAVKVTNSFLSGDNSKATSQGNLMCDLCIAVTSTADLMGICKVEGWSDQYLTQPLIIC